MAFPTGFWRICAICELMEYVESHLAISIFACLLFASCLIPLIVAWLHIPLMYKARKPYTLHDPQPRAKEKYMPLHHGHNRTLCIAAPNNKKKRERSRFDRINFYEAPFRQHCDWYFMINNYRSMHSYAAVHQAAPRLLSLFVNFNQHIDPFLKD